MNFGEKMKLNSEHFHDVIFTSFYVDCLSNRASMNLNQLLAVKLHYRPMYVYVYQRYEFVDNSKVSFVKSHPNSVVVPGTLMQSAN